MITLEFIQTLNQTLAVLSVGLFLISVLIIIDFFYRQYLREVIVRFGLHVSLLATSVGIILSLIYSDVFGFIPCGLCWFERILLYPQAFILTVSLVRKNIEGIYSGIALSVVGLVVSLYHHFIQIGVGIGIKCPTAGQGADCAKRIMYEFDLVTFPLLSVIVFLFLLTIYFYMYRVSIK